MMIRVILFFTILGISQALITIKDETRMIDIPSPSKFTNLVEIGQKDFLFSYFSADEITFLKYSLVDNNDFRLSENFSLSSKGPKLHEYHKLLKLGNGKLLSVCKIDDKVYYYIAENCNDLKEKINLENYKEIKDLIIKSTLPETKIEFMELQNDQIFIAYLLPSSNSNLNYSLFFEVFKIDHTDKTLRKFVNKVFIADSIDITFNISLETLNDKFVFVGYNRKTTEYSHVRLLLTKIRVSDFTFDSECKNIFTFANTANHFYFSKIFAINNFLMVLSNRCSAADYAKYRCHIPLFKFYPDCSVLLNNHDLNEFSDGWDRKFLNAFKINFDRIAIFHKNPIAVDSSKFNINLLILDSNANIILNQIVFSKQVFDFNIVNLQMIKLSNNKYLVSFNNKSNEIHYYYYAILDLDVFATLIVEDESALNISMEKLTDDPLTHVMVMQKRIEGVFKMHWKILDKDFKPIKESTNNTEDTGTQIEPRVIVFSNFDFLVAYKTKGSNDYHTINARKYNKNGEAIGNEETLVGNDSTNPRDLSDYANYDIIALKENKFIIAWHQRERVIIDNLAKPFYYRSYYHIFFVDFKQIFGKTAIGPEIKVKDQMFPNLAKLTNGENDYNEKVVIIYQNNGFQKFGFKIFAFAIDVLDNKKIIQDKQINTQETGNNIYPRSVDLESGEIIITYLSDGIGGENWENRRLKIIAQKISATDLTKIGAEFTIPHQIPLFKPFNLAKSCETLTESKCPVTQIYTTHGGIAGRAIDGNYNNIYNQQARILIHRLIAGGGLISKRFRK